MFGKGCPCFCPAFSEKEATCIFVILHHHFGVGFAVSVPKAVVSLHISTSREH